MPNSKTVVTGSGLSFSSQRSAAKALDVSEATVRRAVNGGGTVNGMRLFTPTNTPRRVTASNGMVFNSIAEAARTLNLDRSHIKAVVNGSRLSAGGLTFRSA